MKTIIIYASVHHGNTKKVVDAIANESGIEIVDATQVKEKDLTSYDAIGFASGQYYSKFHQSVLNFASVNLPLNKDVFFITTCGGKEVWESIEKITSRKNAKILGKFACKGYDTYGPFKLIGGIAKGHPNDKDISNAISFFKSIVN